MSYEKRAHFVEEVPLTAAAAQHGYSRAAFYLIAFDEVRMRGLLDQRRGRRGPLKLTPEIVASLAAAGSAGGWGHSGVTSAQRALKEHPECAALA